MACQYCQESRQAMFASFQEWTARPFANTLSPKDWFLLFGFLIVLSLLWGIIVRTIRDVAA